MSQHSRMYSSVLEFGSYIGSGTILKGVRVGKYSSIGSDVSIIIGRHPSRVFVSTHPAFYSLRKQSGFTHVEEQKFEEYNYFDKENKIRVKIGNDVWIGDKVKIIEGIEIGDGSIVAAGSLVTKDVAPYSIVGGVPARILKMRFPDKDIEFLLEYKWWGLDFDEIEKIAPYFHDLNELKKIRETPI